MTGKDGKPLELGRGAMGVTYKAFDINLRCPVTLEVISERYLGDESARLRFMREARAAASVRHPNVASVFHLRFLYLQLNSPVDCPQKKLMKGRHFLEASSLTIGTALVVPR